MAIGVSAARGESWTIVPSISVGATYSSNMSLTNVSPQSGWIADIAPGIRIDGKGARLNGFLDYRRDKIFYQNHSEWEQYQNRLNSLATLEVLDNWLFVDGAANIAQRNRNSFGPTSTSGTNATGNQFESRTALLSPYIRGRIAGSAEYMVRANAVDSRSDDPTLANTRVNQAIGAIKEPGTAGSIGWFGDATFTNVKNDVIGSLDDDRFRAGVIVPMGMHLHISLSDGRESTNFVNATTESNSTPGWGVEWSPGKHTQVVGLSERRFFGTGHSLVATHSTSQTAFRYTDVKDVAVLPSLVQGYDPNSVGELMSTLLESSIADPVDRRQAVRSRMDAFAGAGDFTNGAGVQTSRLYVERIREGSIARLSARDTLALTVRQRDQELISGSPVADDSFDSSAEIQERGITLAWSHRLTLLTSLSMSTGYTRAVGKSADDLSYSQRTVTAALLFRLSPKATATLGVSTLRAAGTVTSEIRENAIAGSVTQGF